MLKPCTCLHNTKKSWKGKHYFCEKFDGDVNEWDLLKMVFLPFPGRSVFLLFYFFFFWGGGGGGGATWLRNKAESQYKGTWTTPMR